MKLVVRFLFLSLLLLLPVQSEAARLFTSGFEENSTTLSMWDNFVGNAPTIGTTDPHSGTYEMNTNSASANSSLRGRMANLVTTEGRQYFYSFTVRASDATPSANSAICSEASSGLAQSFNVSWLTTGVLRLTNTVTANTVDSVTTLSDNTKYRIEVRHKLSDLSAGELELRIYTADGTTPIETPISITGEDTLNVNAHFFFVGKTASTAVFSFDDVRVNDDVDPGDGSNMTWLGPGKIYLLTPNADTSVTWENEAAGTATFAKIHDLPGTPDDATTYNTEVVNLNSVDRFGLTALGAEVPSNAVISTVAVYARAGSNQTSSTRMRLKLWDEGGSLTNGGEFQININGWKILNFGEQLAYNATGKTKANLDSFDIGYENTTDVATRERRVTALWANVEWTEGTSQTFFQRRLQQ